MIPAYSWNYPALNTLLLQNPPSTPQDIWELLQELASPFVIQQKHQQILQALAEEGKSDFDGGEMQEVLKKIGCKKGIGDPLVLELFSKGLLLLDKDTFTYRIPEGIRECVLATK
ncbi:hypothetical protein D6833_13110 [Candidatus Parcubacteria bacterium]|nr:MAG: hypothetical protein D6833_13110 [Candidatus Parcubacteria bacterium]